MLPLYGRLSSDVSNVRATVQCMFWLLALLRMPATRLLLTTMLCVLANAAICSVRLVICITASLHHAI